MYEEMSKPVPKSVRLDNEGTPRGPRRSQGRRLAVTRGDGEVG